MPATLRVQNVADTGTGATSANTSLAGVQAGDLLVVCFRERDGGGIPSLTVSSDLDGAFTQAVTRAANAARVWLGYRKNASAGTHVVTVDYGGASVVFDMNASAWGGCVTTGGADTTNNNGGTATTTPNHGSITPSAGALIISAWGGTANDGETLGGDGMTALTNTSNAASDYLGKQFYQYKVGHTGAIDADFTTATAAAYDGVIAAFLETAGATGAAPVFAPQFTRGRRPSGFRRPA